MEQDNFEDVRKKADRFESQYNKLKLEFREYIESSKKNEEKKRQEIKSDFSKRLLVVADSLTRITALDNEAPCEMVKNYSDNTRKNIEAIYSQMLSASGLGPIEPAKGDKFDEQKHIAVGLEFGTRHPENTIFRVIRKGYILENHVVRPAEVIISKNPSEQKVIKIGLRDRFIRLVKPEKAKFSEIDRKMGELERAQKEKLDKIALDMESLRISILELDEKAKQMNEFERIQKEKLDNISNDMESLRNTIHEMDVKPEHMQKGKLDKIPWI